jgi:hypothetical protein
MAELKSGDLCIEGSEQFADYREQLISWEEYAQTVADYSAQVGLPVDSTAFVAQMCLWLEEMGAEHEKRKILALLTQDID